MRLFQGLLEMAQGWVGQPSTSFPWDRERNPKNLYLHLFYSCFIQDLVYPGGEKWRCVCLPQCTFELLLKRKADVFPRLGAWLGALWGSTMCLYMHRTDKLCLLTWVMVFLWLWATNSLWLSHLLLVHWTGIHLLPSGWFPISSLGRRKSRSL